MGFPYLLWLQHVSFFSRAPRRHRRTPLKINMEHIFKWTGKILGFSCSTWRLVAPRSLLNTLPICLVPSVFQLLYKNLPILSTLLCPTVGKSVNRNQLPSGRQTRQCKIPLFDSFLHRWFTLGTCLSSSSHRNLKKHNQTIYKWNIKWWRQSGKPATRLFTISNITIKSYKIHKRLVNTSPNAIVYDTWRVPQA